jgi:hypothetical protein
MVKLSRTILGFFVLSTLVGIGFVVAVGVTTGLLVLVALTGLVAGLAAGLGAGFAGALAGMGLVATGATLRAGVVRLVAALTEVVDGVATAAFTVDVMVLGEKW